MVSFPVIFINSASIILIVVVIVSAWRKRSNTAATQLIAAAIFMAVWAVSSFAEMMISGTDQKILWRNITQIGVFYVPPACLFFSIVYTGIFKKIKKPLTYILYSVQTVSILLIFTDTWLHLMRKSIEIVSQDGYNTVVVQSTLLSKILISFNFIYMAAALLMLIVFAVRTNNKMRKQVLITLAGMGIAAAYAMIKVSSNEQFSMFLPISGIFGIVCVAMLLGIFKYGFLMVLPVARNEVFNIIDEGIVVASPKGEVIDANAAAMRFFSLNSAQPINNSAKGFLEIDSQLKERYPSWHHALMTCKAKKLRFSQNAVDTALYYQCDTYVLDNKKRTIGTISVIRDITEQKIKNDLLKIRAERDGLVDIFNRQTFIERVNHRLNRSDKAAGLIFLDLDDFKNINDTYGHMAGDYVLNKVCECIKQTMDPRSIIGRIGGEEFAVFFAGTDAAHTMQTAECLRSNVEQKSFKYRGQLINVTISIGIAVGKGMSFQQLYQNADHMLYAAKKAGKNCIKANTRVNVV